MREVTRPPLLAVLFVLLAWAGGRAALAEGAVLIREARVFDGTRIVEATDVLFREGVIEKVGSGLEAPEGARVIEARGKTLLPGLFDCHTHIIAPAMLRQALAFGVTTELDMFMSDRLLRKLREEPDPRRADFRSAGTLVTAPRGHGTQFGLDIPTIVSPEEAEAFVDARIEEGSDYIKVVYDDGRAIGFQIPSIELETLEAVIAAAHARKKLAVVHVHDYEAAREAIEAGADGLVHIFADREPEESFVELALEKNVFVTPTLAIIESVAGSSGGPALADDERLAPYLSRGDRNRLKNTLGGEGEGLGKFSLKTAREAVRALAKAGVPILCGSDAPNPGTLHGVSVHRELELLVECGLEPEAALRAATSTPARIFGLDDRGRIAPGLRADLLLVDGDPTEDIRATRAVAGIWKTGEPVDREAYRREIRGEDKALEGLGKSAVSVVSDFEGDKVSSRFGSGWQVSTDKLFGGQSTGKMELVPGGARESEKSLRIQGKIDGGLPYAWAGAMFFPGDTPFAPADLSAKKSVRFWAKGDGKPARVLLFARVLGRVPASKEFIPGDEWKLYELELSSFDERVDGGGIQGILFTGGPKPGEFSFQIDEVAFE